MNSEVRPFVRYILSEYSRGRPIEDESMLGEDLGIYGSDCIEVLDHLKAKFNVDLDPLIARGPLERTGCIYRLFSIEPRRAGVDVSVEQLIAYIEDHIKLQ